MSGPLSFGVELEFALAYVRSPTPKPYELETRKVVFQAQEGSLGPHIGYDFPMVRKDILETLSDAGFPVNLTSRYDEDDTTMWRVSADPSITTHLNNTAVAQVEEVIMLLVKTYCLHLNSSTGLHCHVSAGQSTPPFSVQTVKQLVAFLWLFEPQLISPHPTDRVLEDYYARSMRKASEFSKKFNDKHGRNPDPLEGAMHFLESTDTSRVVIDCSAGATRKYMAYNLSNLASDYNCFDGNCSKKTIEFRGHAGCLDPLRVRAWIQTVVGVVSWAREATPSDVSTLFGVAKHETWQKLGDWKDDKRQEKMGPILAESKFTLIDLLTHIQLYEPAAFYIGQLHKHPGYIDHRIHQSTFKPYIHWEYEAKKSEFKNKISELKQYKDSEEYTEAHEMRLLWEAFTAASATLPVGLKLDLHDHDPMWPAHTDKSKLNAFTTKLPEPSPGNDYLWTRDCDKG